jgi:hypothetical protein
MLPVLENFGVDELAAARDHWLTPPNFPITQKSMFFFLDMIVVS